MPYKTPEELPSGKSIIPFGNTSYKRIRGKNHDQSRIRTPHDQKEREQNNNNRLFAREINAVYEQHPSDVYAFGIDMFLLGIAKGRRMEKAARKGGAR